MSINTCLVCGYSGDPEFHPADYQICGCCGTEFGYDDRVLSHEQLRVVWIRNGCPWFDEGEPKPAHWNPYIQLSSAGFGSDILKLVTTAESSADSKPSKIPNRHPIRNVVLQPAY